MAGKYDVVISLLVYNQPLVTRECIESLLKTAKSNYLLVISDNNSQQTTAKYLKTIAEKHENIIYVRNDENIGFIAAHNKIYSEYSALSDFFCVLNNDLVFKIDKWDISFLDALKSDDKAAQVGPLQVHGYINNNGVGIPRPNRKAEPEYIEGSCFIAKVKDVGSKLFESKYMKFAFCEDADLSFRLRSSGKTLLEVENVDIHHKHHVSFKNEKLVFDYKEQERANQRFFIDRWQKYMKFRKFAPLQILIIRTGALGDSFMVEPIARELSNKYPDSHIHVQTACGEWFTPCSYIKKCGNNLKARQHYDIVIDLDMVYESNPKMHVIDAYAQKAMVILEDSERIPKYGIDNIVKGSKIAVINSEGSWASRQWPIERIREFAVYLKGKGYTVKEVGRTQSLYTGIGENLIGKMRFKEVCQVIGEADLYFGMDGGLAHFAQAMGVKSFLIFGCTNPEYRIHDEANVKALWLDKDIVPCAGCHHEGKPKTFTACATGNHECLDKITVDYAIKQFEAWQ